jgi:hypothetical protein
MIRTGSMREFFHRQLSDEIARVFNPLAPFNTNCGVLTFSEVSQAWTVIFALSVVAECWIQARRRFEQAEDNARLVPVVNRDFLRAQIRQFLKVDDPRAECLVAQFSCRLEGSKEFDLYLKPLMELTNGMTVIPVSFVQLSRFERNIFTIAERAGAADLSPRGFNPREALASRFRDDGFGVKTNVPVVLDGQTITDADILIAKDRFLFVGQVKVVIDPDGAYEHWKVKQTLLNGADQLVKTVHAINSNFGLFLSEMDIRLSDAALQPFLLTNALGFTGTQINGFPVVDFKYLDWLLGGAMLSIARERNLRKIRPLQARSQLVLSLRYLLQAHITVPSSTDPS